MREPTGGAALPDRLCDVCWEPLSHFDFLFPTSNEGRKITVCLANGKDNKTNSGLI